LELNPSLAWGVMKTQASHQVPAEYPTHKGECNMIDSPIPTSQPVIEQLEDQPNLLMGLIGGVFAMLVGAVAWGAITYFSEYQISWMAIGVGFLVGAAIRFFGRGKSITFGVSGAALALIGCLLGNLIFYSGVIAREEGYGFLDIFMFLLFQPLAAVEIFAMAFSAMDLLFYALAAYVGFSTAMDIKRSRT
jgi:hypothetical protein